MPTDNVYISGVAKWATLKDPNPWGAWTITVYPDSKSLDRIRELQSKGLKNVIKKDDEGWFVAFRRPQQNSRGGKVMVFPPPEVLGPDGKTPLTDLVGNGSKVTVKLETYTHNTPGGGKAIAARLAAVKVEELVKYNEGLKDEQAVANNEPLF